jgi:DNA-cytosine methyltransferase
MKVLSLFDGISCARVALDRAGIAVESYSASEVDPKAISITQSRWPSTIQLGDVREVHIPAGQIDLLIGGSPCTDLSIAKAGRQGLEGEHSSLFWEYVRVLRETKPRWFILENVASMPKKDKDIITQELGVEPVLFDASLVSAQTRKRLFWTNISFKLPADRGVLLKDILQPDAEVDESMTVKGNLHIMNSTNKIGHIGNTDGQANRVYSTEGKSVTLSAQGGGGGAKTGLYQLNSRIRKLTPIECERLQGLPDGYTEGIPKTHRYKCLGNAFNVDVVAHILSHLHH